MAGFVPPIIELHGSPYQIGLLHGRSLSKQILTLRENYRELFEQICDIKWSRVLQIAEKYRETIGRLAPHLLDEMRGISDGVGVDLLDIIAMNSRSEIALGKWDDGCTSLAWTFSQRSSKKQTLAQNWDWRPEVGLQLAMVKIVQPGKPDIWMVIEPGIVGKIGFNSASVGVCLNAIKARQVSPYLLPIHVILRLILECTSVQSAISQIEALGGAGSSQHILVADSNGSRGLELSPLGGVYLEPNPHGVLAHTNHLLENKLVDELPFLSGSPTVPVCMVATWPQP